MTDAVRNSVISGLGISRIGRRTGIPGLELTMEAVRTAIADAGLEPSDIDGLTSLGDTPPGQVARALGVEPGYRGGGIDTGGLLSPVMSAALAVGEGRARHVLVYRTVQMLGGAALQAGGGGGGGAGGGAAGGESGGGAAGGESGGGARSGTEEPAYEGMASLAKAMTDTGDLLAANAFSAANWLALTCRRHMELYGTTKEQLGWLALNSRSNAALNPLAVYRDPMTMDDYLGARPVSSPFGLLDCDVPIDGSIAVVVSPASYAGHGPNPAVRINAIGGSEGTGGWFHRPDFPRMASADAAAQMWNATDLRPTDIDVAELYDGFTFLTFAWLEALGICGDGEAGPFVEGAKRIALDGELPLNTYGGQLSAGRMHGYWILHEACLQLRGQAGERQVAGSPQVAVAAVGGGPIAGCMLLTVV